MASLEKSQQARELEHKISLSIPFPNVREAEIALEAIAPDPPLRPEESSRHIYTTGNVLKAELAAVSDRVLRVAVNSLLDSLVLVVECQEQLNLEALRK